MAKQEIDKEAVISGLQYLLTESKVASAKIEFSYDMDRVKRRITELEEENVKVKSLLKLLFNSLSEKGQL